MGCGGAVAKDSEPVEPDAAVLVPFAEAVLEPEPSAAQKPAPKKSKPPVTKRVSTPCDACGGQGSIPELGKCEFCQGEKVIWHEVQVIDVEQQPALARDVTEIPTFNCLQCPASFARECTLRRHMDTVHSPSEAESHYPRYWVYTYEEPSPWAKALQRAINKLEETNEPKHQPDEVDPSGPRPPCRYGSRCYNQGADHLARFSHPGDDDYSSDPSPWTSQTCPVCGKVFISGHGLRRHTKAKHRETDNIIPGCVCHGFGVCAVCLSQEPLDVPGTPFDQMFMVEETMLQGFRALVKATYQENCTRDRPCPNTPPCGKVMDGGCECVNINCKGPHQNPGMPLGYRVVKVVRVENSSMWDRYTAQRAQIIERRWGELGFDGVATEVLSSPEVAKHRGLFATLQKRANEVILFHGTSLRSALCIAQQDIRLELAGSQTGGGFGQGFYLAESITKADEYARDESGGYYDNTFAVLIFRVCLGKPYTTTTFDVAGTGQSVREQVESGEFDSVIGDRKKGTGTFREFVVYNRDQAYPEYLLIYERMYKDTQFGRANSVPVALTLQVPVYWMNCHLDPVKQEFRDKYPVRKLTLEMLQRLIAEMISQTSADKVDVVSAVRVEDSAMWTAYDRRKASLQKKWALSEGERCVPPHRLEGGPNDGRVMTSEMLLRCEAEAAISLENLAITLNEFLLFHGTTKGAAYAISQTGFVIDRSTTSTRFGHGAYFAEDVLKSLSYAEDSDGKRYLLLCRVVCGQMYYTDKSQEPTATVAAKAAGKDSTLANPENAGPREFVVFDESQVYPEYILEVVWRS